LTESASEFKYDKALIKIEQKKRSGGKSAQALPMLCSQEETDVKTTI